MAESERIETRDTFTEPVCVPSTVLDSEDTEVDTMSKRPALESSPCLVRGQMITLGTFM